MRSFSTNQYKPDGLTGSTTLPGPNGKLWGEPRPSRCTAYIVKYCCRFSSEGIGIHDKVSTKVSFIRTYGHEGVYCEEGRVISGNKNSTRRLCQIVD